MPDDRRPPRSRPRFDGELPDSPRGPAHRQQPPKTPPRQPPPIADEPTVVKPPVPRPAGREQPRRPKPAQRKPVPPLQRRRAGNPADPVPPPKPLPSRPLVEQPPAAKPPVKPPAARKPPAKKAPVAEPTRAVERTMFPGPKPTRSGEKTGTYRPWRNEPTVLIPAVQNDEELPPDKPAPESRLREKRKRKDRRALVLAKSSLALAAVLVFFAAGGAWGMKKWFDSKFTEVAALDEESKDIRHKAAQIGTENFLILGSDTRAGAPKGAGIGTEKTIKGARSDTLMIAHLPKDRKRAIMVSFPRDLEITRPECYRWNYKTGNYSKELIPETPQVKLNTAYAEGGPKCVIKWVQKQTGMRMNHFVGIDFSGFKGMVDAVGGVEVNVDMPIVDSILGTVVDKPGRVRLNGDRALSFVRARHVAGDPTSDYGRIKRQQQFIAALLAKTMSREVLLSPSKLTGFVNAFAASTFGDNTGVDELLELAQSMKGMNSKSVKFLTVPTTGYANELGNEVLLEEQAAEIFSALIHNTAVPGIDDEKKKSNGTSSSGDNSSGENDSGETQAQDADNP